MRKNVMKISCYMVFRIKLSSGFDFREFIFIFFRHGAASFFSISNQRPDLAIQDLENFLFEKFTDPSPDLPIKGLLFFETRASKRSKALHSDPRPVKFRNFCLITDPRPDCNQKHRFYTKLSIVLIFLYCLNTVNARFLDLPRDPEKRSR